MSDPVRTDAPRTPAAEAPDFAALLARWAEVAPEECRRDALQPSLFDVGMGLWAPLDTLDLRDEEHAIAIGACVYHAARRGLTLLLDSQDDSGQVERGVRHVLADVGDPEGAFARGGQHAAVTDPRDGAAALRAAATALLSAYLDAVQA